MNFETFKLVRALESKQKVVCQIFATTFLGLNDHLNKFRHNTSAQKLWHEDLKSLKDTLIEFEKKNDFELKQEK